MSGDQDVYPRKFKFFRVMLPGFSSKLPLPSMFINCFVEGKGTWATLLSPLGRSWHVKVVHGDDQGMNFADGWQKFAVDHNLDTGDFLVFKHHGDLVFDVTIFDLTTGERNYHHSAPCGVTIPREENKYSSSSSKEDKYELEASKCFRRQTTCSHGKRAAEEMVVPGATKRRPVVFEDIRQSGDDRPRMAKNRPHQFELVIRKHHHRSHLELPTSFRRSSAVSGVRHLFLRDPKGQLWPAKLCHGKSGTRTHSTIYAGWREFCAANNLKAGDSCVFELKGGNELHREEKGLRQRRAS